MIYQIQKRRSASWNCYLWLSLLLFTGSCASGPTAPSAEEAEKAIIEKETQALDNWSSGDPAGFALHAADDITYMDDIGASSELRGREAFLQYLTSLEGMIPPHQYKMEDPYVQAYGNVAILTFHYQAVDSAGQPGGAPWKATSVYNFRENDWYMVHANWSLVKEQ